MSNRLFNLVNKMTLPATQKAVLSNIAYCVNEKKGEDFAYPTIEALAQKVGKTKRSIITTIGNLEHEGFLIVEKRGYKGDYHGAKLKNAYRIIEAKCQENSKTTSPKPVSITSPKPVSKLHLKCAVTSPINGETTSPKPVSITSPKQTEQTHSTTASIENAKTANFTSEKPPIYNYDPLGQELLSSVSVVSNATSNANKVPFTVEAANQKKEVAPLPNNKLIDLSKAKNTSDPAFCLEATENLMAIMGREPNDPIFLNKYAAYFAQKLEQGATKEGINAALDLLSGKEFFDRAYNFACAQKNKNDKNKIMFDYALENAPIEEICPF
jgi:hypothetical protein